MVDHLQSRGTPCRLCASHVKVHGTLSKMDVYLLLTLSYLGFSIHAGSGAYFTPPNSLVFFGARSIKFGM